MNYRHAVHAGNFADVLKHAVLGQCFAHLKKKDKPFRYIDTHAGIGVYDLTSGEAQRIPEWQGGIATVLKVEKPVGVQNALAPYLSAVTALNPAELKAYPGSPELAARLLRRQDRIQLCELQPANARALDQIYKRDARVKVETRDGFKALAGLVPPRERRGVVLIDPAFEHRDEMAHMAEAVRAVLPRWPSGTWIFWRPLKDLWASERFDVGLAEWLFEEELATPEKLLRADLWVRELENEGKLAGAGVVVVNPPFTLEQHLLALLPWLAKTLAQGEGAGWRLDGCATEDSLSVEEF